MKNWFLDLSISKKILMLSLVSSILIGIVGFIGYHFTTKASDEMTEMYQDRLLPIEWLGQCMRHAHANRANLFNLILENDENKQQEIVNNINIRGKDFLALIADYEKTKLDKVEIDNLVKLKQALAEYKIDRIKIADLALKGDRKEAYLYFVENKDSFEAFTNTLRELIKYNEKVAHEINEQNHEEAKEATMLIITTLIIALIASVVISLWIAKMISNPINVVVENLNQVSKGNLAVDEIKNDSKDETGKLSRALNTTVKNLRELIASVAKSVEDISAGSEEMSASSDQTAQGAQQTANSTAQLAKGAQEMSLNVETGANNISQLNKVIQQISSEALEISDLGNETEENANAGNEHVKKAVNKIDSIKQVSGDISVTIAELGKLSSEIEQIVDLIKSIAGQTNLLALNAAIEAARAGEHGKGFAVVAEEVKKLATQSAEATDNITSMIKEIQAKTQIAVSTMNKATNEVEEGVYVVNDAGKALENIISQVKTANNKIQGITQNIEGVARNSEDVLKMIENISAVTEETAASAEEISSITEEQTASLQEISASSQTLARVAENLNKQVSIFKI